MTSTITVSSLWLGGRGRTEYCTVNTAVQEVTTRACPASLHAIAHGADTTLVA